MTNTLEDYINIKTDEFGNQHVRGFVGKYFDQFYVNKNQR